MIQFQLTTCGSRGEMQEHQLLEEGRGLLLNPVLLCLTPDYHLARYLIKMNRWWLWWHLSNSPRPLYNRIRIAWVITMLYLLHTTLLELVNKYTFVKVGVFALVLIICSYDILPTSWNPRMELRSSPSGFSSPPSESVSGLFIVFDESSSGRVISRGVGQWADPPLPCSSTSPGLLLLPSDQVCPTPPLPWWPLRRIGPAACTLPR